MWVGLLGVMSHNLENTRPVRPAHAAGVPNADGLCCYRVWEVHELHNERWYDHKDYLRFCESKSVLDLPSFLLSGVKSDLDLWDVNLWDDTDSHPSFEEVMATETIQRYCADIQERGKPECVPVERAKTSYTVLTRETDPAVVSEMCYAANHHYQIVAVEPCEYDPDARLLD